MKSLLALLASAALTGSLFAGCSSEPAAPAAPAAESAAADAAAPAAEAPAEAPVEAAAEASGEPATITYISWDVNQEAGMSGIAEAFMAANPNVTVNVEVTPGDQYWPKLEAAANANSMPDTLWMHPSNFIKYSKGGKLADLSEKVAASEIVDLANFPEDLVELNTYEGKLFALPKDFDTIALWYNKTLFDAAGVAYPDETWDWATLKDAAIKLTDPANDVYGFAAYVDMQQFVYNMIYQNNGFPISDDKTASGYTSPETIEALQFCVDFALTDKSSPTPEQFANTNQNQMFESGKVAMLYAGSWMTSEFYNNEYTRQNCDVAVLPQGKTRASIYNGLGNAMSVDSKYPDAAWKFLEFMGSKEANEIMSQHGSAIPAYKGLAQGWIDHFEGFNVKAYPEMLDYAVPFPSNWEGNAAFSAEENNLIAPLFAGTVTVEEGAANAAEVMNGYIAG